MPPTAGNDLRTGRPQLDSGGVENVLDFAPRSIGEFAQPRSDSPSSLLYCSTTNLVSSAARPGGNH
jgi:hypothetical protein